MIQVQCLALTTKVCVVSWDKVMMICTMWLLVLGSGMVTTLSINLYTHHQDYEAIFAGWCTVPFHCVLLSVVAVMLLR